LPQINPGFNNAPFKFTKYSNAYMLVYIRESDKDKIMCNVDEKDIAEHLRVCVVLHSHSSLGQFPRYHDWKIPSHVSTHVGPGPMGHSHMW
jgi:hypothetical protein